MEEMIDELLGNLDQIEDEITIDAQLTDAALLGNGLLMVKLEDEKRKEETQEFARKCKTDQDRLDEINEERQHTLREQQAVTQQREIAAGVAHDKGLEFRQAQIEYNALQLKLAFIEDRLLILRDEYNDVSRELREKLATRKEGMDQQ